MQGTDFLFLHNFFHSASSFTICRYLGYYQNLGVSTLSQQITVPMSAKNADTNHQSTVFIRCLLLLVGHCLTDPQRTQGLKETVKSILLPRALKFNLPASYSFSPLGGLANVHSSRQKMRNTSLFHPTNALQTYWRLHLHHQMKQMGTLSFSTHFYKKLASVLLVLETCWNAFIFSHIWSS